MGKRALIAMLLTPLPAMAAGVSFDETAFKGLQYGLICGADSARTEPAPDTTTGTIKIVQDWQKILVETQMVPLVKGLGFGVTLSPASPRILDNVRVTLTHPPYHGNGDTVDSWVTDFDASSPNLNFFEFEHDFEMVTGTWTLEANQGDRQLYSVTFEVVPASRLPHLANLCKGESLTS